MHRHTLNVCAKASLKHLAVRLVTRHIHTGFKACHALGSGQGFAPVQQPIEKRSARWPRLHRAELDVAFIVPCLRIGTTVTDRESNQYLILPEKNGVTQPLRGGGTDFPLHIQPSIQGIRQCVTSP
jgi:hypothetical protein